jgi:hypothetical protein
MSAKFWMATKLLKTANTANCAALGFAKQTGKAKCDVLQQRVEREFLSSKGSVNGNSCISPNK